MWTVFARSLSQLRTIFTMVEEDATLLALTSPRSLLNITFWVLFEQMGTTPIQFQ